MLKAILLLVVISIYGLSTYWNKIPVVPPKNEISLNSATESASTPETLGASTTLLSDTSAWKSYEDSTLEIRIKFPSGINPKKEINRSLTLFGDLLKINISLENLNDKDTVNTLAESNINSKITKMGDSFKLIDSISPISIGEITGVTFTTIEDGQEITYYYVPREKSYLIIKDSTDKSLVALSDSIIYSLEIL